MKARGLDPKEISEAAGDNISPKIINHLLSENKLQAMKPKPSNDSRTSNKLVDDNDLPPSTPAASPLNVPTVTHTSKGGGAHQLHDERNKNITTRVSGLLLFRRAVNLFVKVDSCLSSFLQVSALFTRCVAS